MRPDLPMRCRICNGALIGLLVGMFFYFVGFPVQGFSDRADFGWALSEAAALKAGYNPYLSLPFGVDSVPYPLTSALLAFPFLALPRRLAAAVFLALSSALLGFAVSKGGHRYMLIFLSYPFWSAVWYVQWSPLLTAAAVLPWIFPAIIAKPNLGLAIAATKGTPKGLLACAVGVAFSLAIFPSWPLWWLHETAGYQSFVPLLSGFGALLLLALPWSKDTDVQMLLAMALVPQRWYYDALPLCLIPESTLELLGTALLSWGTFFLTSYPRTMAQVAPLFLLFNYLPMLLVVLARRRFPFPFVHPASPKPGVRLAT